MSKKEFKKWVKVRIQKAAFEFLLNEKEKQSKIKNISYKKFEMQKYLKSKLFSNEEIELLNKLRAKMIDVKVNFSSMYKNNLKCSIDGCLLDESQEHLIQTCQPLLDQLNLKNHNIKYQDLFGSTKKQIKATQLFAELLEIRSDILFFLSSLHIVFRSPSYCRVLTQSTARPAVRW